MNHLEIEVADETVSLKNVDEEFSTSSTAAAAQSSSKSPQFSGMLTNTSDDSFVCFVMEYVYERYLQTTKGRCLLLLLFLLSGAMVVVLQPNKSNVEIPMHDFSDIESPTDLEQAEVIFENRCRKDADICRCGDPLKPVQRDERHQERHEYLTNIAIPNYVKSVDSQDLVFLGDSITQNMLGYYIDVLKRFKYTEDAIIFNQYFSLKYGGKINGLALGIAGDQSPHLLWRIQNGELPETLNPKAFWLLIGINDLGLGGCSAETVLIGILGVVEEILARKPSSKVVINGLLPFSEKRNGRLGKQWERILAINEQLQLFTEKHDRTEYFDATNIFVEEDDGGNMKINTDIMPDRLHPNHIGYSMWFEKIIEKYFALSFDN
eukprot:CAMPEP_0196806264 /NCGR_PEP_ID=MMETSP1362-20130617/6151_1 /TAXON_ID=163516 /ORGANISM="Leptocylindrus danicus, Strain CCMP1856" /LENGTH=377 /DNA_ID=CAMNT_0042179661 /DNA_START=199 /DNA_END=1332 /DNA_ORIENTATION=+